MLSGGESKPSPEDEKVEFDVDADGQDEEAQNQDGNGDNGFEVFVDPDQSSKITQEIDGDGDGKVDYLIDINGTDQPEVYWDPDDNIVTEVIAENITGDERVEFLIDTDGDGKIDRYYDTELHDYPPDTGEKIRDKTVTTEDASTVRDSSANWIWWVLALLIASLLVTVATIPYWFHSVKKHSR